MFYNKTINKKELKSIIKSTFHIYGLVKTMDLAESLKKSGFAFATQAGISISIEDLKVPPTKDELFLKNNSNLKLAYYYEKRGNTNEIERFQKVIDTWHTTSEILKNQLVSYFKEVDPLNPVYMMAFSGARGNLSQVRQLVGMRGLMSDPNGQIIDIPIKTNFREGLSITDYVISSYGARKGIVDTALRTADSGYLTRRLVDVAQHIIIRELDCQTKNGVRLTYDPTQSKKEQYLGRVLAKSITVQGVTLIKKNTILTVENLNLLSSPTNLVLRSPLTCESSRSICQKCYGWNLAQGQLVELADAVGIIAAQSIGEPGTQLTMRTFHTGGVFTGESNNQIRSICDGQVLFSSSLKTLVSRTLHGETVLKVQNVSELFIFNPLTKTLKRCSLTPEMLLFISNKDFIKSGDLIAESSLLNKRTTTRLKNIFTDVSGEVQFQNIAPMKNSQILGNGLIWVATGKVYDIFKNMVIKCPKEKIVKNNAIAQTKITCRFCGMLKSDGSNKNSDPNYLITWTTLTHLTHFYRTKANEIFTLTKNKEVLFFKSQSLGEIQNDSTLIHKGCNKYTLLEDHTVHYSRVAVSTARKIQGNGIFIFKKLNSEINLDSSQVYVIESSFESKKLNNTILYPGEAINPNIEVQVLSFCQILDQNEYLVKLVLSPLKQWLVPKYIKQSFVLKNTSGPELISDVSILPSDNTSFTANTSFIKVKCTILAKSPNVPVLKLFDFPSSQSQALTFFQMFELPSQFIKLSKGQISTSYLSTSGQYIQPYSIIATINCITHTNLFIRNIKNSSQRPNRFLIATNTNYKNYLNGDQYKKVKSKFVVVGDKVKKDEATNYSGYQIYTGSNANLLIRISQPFFVSSGTKIFVQHGALLQTGESLFQFLYTRIVTSDIVTGLPRIEQLLESRRASEEPCQLIKHPGVAKSRGGTFSILEKSGIRHYSIMDPTLHIINTGDLVTVAQPLDSLLIDPHEVLKSYFQYYCSLYAFENAAKRSIVSIQILLVNLIQDVYKSQGIYISNKHIEVIIRQITSKVKISEIKTGLSLEVGEMVEFEQAKYINSALKSTKKGGMEYQPVLLGITKVSLMTESFISSASFQETTRVLTKAAIEGKVEWLRGLKENVILGRLIPAGTGFKAFTSLPLLKVRL